MDADAEELSGKVMGGFPVNVQTQIKCLLTEKRVTPRTVPVRRVAPAVRPLVHKAQQLKLYCEPIRMEKSPNLTARSCTRVVRTSVNLPPVKVSLEKQ